MMSIPIIPNITPEIDLEREDVINMLLASIALEAIGLAHIINAEGEKIQAVVGSDPSVDDLIKIDKSVGMTLRDVIKKEMLLQFKLENILDLIDKDSGYESHHKKK